MIHCYTFVLITFALFCTLQFLLNVASMVHEFDCVATQVGHARTRQLKIILIASIQVMTATDCDCNQFMSKKHSTDFTSLRGISGHASHAQSCACKGNPPHGIYVHTHALLQSQDQGIIINLCTHTHTHIRIKCIAITEHLSGLYSMATTNAKLIF